VLYRLASARPDMIVYGCLLAMANRAIRRPLSTAWRRGLGVAAGISWMAFFSFLVLGNRAPGFELFGGPVYQGCLLLLGPMILDLYLRQGSRAARLLSHPALCWVGVRSYGIYLWHIPVLYPFLVAMAGMTRTQRLPLGLLAAALGVGAGVLSYRYVELPFQIRRDRTPRGDDAEVADAPALAFGHDSDGTGE
jgi:peptidoglycan/LPS O-acetylase OafA/YrhL